MSKSKFMNAAEEMKDKLGPSLCLAKWQQVSLHLPTGLNNSCYHPPLHEMDAQVIEFNPSAIHNTHLMSLKAIIIGSGIGGIASAIRLACQGYEVTVFEKNAFAGGKLSSFSLGDYRFDVGPSLFTMPQFVDALFELAGENPRDHFNYKRKSVGCQSFWEDGMRLKAYGDTHAFLAEVEKQLHVPKKRLQKYLDKAAMKYNRTKALFLEQSLHKWQTYLSADTRKGIAKLFAYELETSLHHVNHKQLQEKVLKIKLVLERLKILAIYVMKF